MKDKKQNLVINDQEEENEENLNYEEYENLFFVPSEDEIEEGLEIARLLASIEKNYRW